MPSILNEFFAVTETSLYHVQAKGPWAASVVKVASRDPSRVEVGFDIAKGGMIAICRRLQGFIPEKYGASHPLTGYERRLEQVNTRYWTANSSDIVALFKSKNEALECLKVNNARICDNRWFESTKQVLEEIGEEHPSFYISHDFDLELVRFHKAA